MGNPKHMASGTPRRLYDVHGPASADDTTTLAALAAQRPLIGSEPGQVEPAAVDEAAPTRVERAVERDDAADKDGAGLGADVEANVGRSAAMMSVLVIVSRITGFLRTWGQAYALGVTVTASCYTVANNLPNQLYELVMGGMLVTAFLPVYLSVKKRSGVKGASDYASNLVSLVTILMGVVFILSVVFAYQVVLTQSYGASSEFDYGLATYFMRFFAIEVVFYALSSLFSGILNAERDYFWSTAAPIFNNFICTASFVGYAVFMDSNPTLAVLILAVGNPLGVLVQVLMQIPSMRRKGIRIRPYVNIHDPAIKETLSIGIPSLVVTFASFITVSVQSSSALSVTASGAAVAYYARLWYILPYSIFAIPITTAMFTELSEAVSGSNISGFKRGIMSGTSRILFLLIPFAMYLVTFSPVLIRLLNSGSFSAEDIELTSSYLKVLSLSLPFYGVCTYLQKVCSSYRRMNLYAIASVVAGVIQVVFCVVLTPRFGLNMVALSSLFFFIAVDVVTFASLRRSLGPLGFTSLIGTTLRSLVFGAAGALVGWAVMWALEHVLGLAVTNAAMAVVFCVVAGLPAVVMTFGAAVLFRVPEASFITSLVRRR